MDKEYYLQITGKTYLDQSLEKDKSYSIVFEEIGIYGIDERSGNGENEKITFKGKSVSKVSITDGKEIIKGEKKKQTQSQRTRYAIEKRWDEQFAGKMRDEEKFYDLVQGLFRFKLSQGDYDNDIDNLINQYYD